MRYFISVMLLACIGCKAPLPRPVVDPSLDANMIAHGKELVQGLAACGSCHGERSTPTALLVGGRQIEDSYGLITAPNLSSDRQTGLGKWSANNIVEALRGSHYKNGAIFSSNAHWGYEWLSDEDAYSIAGYIKTLPPIKNQIKKRELGIIDRNTSGIFAPQAKQASGFIPPIIKNKTIEYGQYLVDHVARCVYCHSSQATFFSDSAYLYGGRTIKIGEKEKLAPNITNNEVEGIGSWNEKHIISYLKSGVTPDSRKIDPNFCPTNFYTKASDADLNAIAAYLLKASTATQQSAESSIRKVGGRTNKKPKRSDSLSNR